MNDFERIQSLIKDKAEVEARLNLLPYDGSPEIKENHSGKYLYIRKRVAGKLTSKYVDVYSDDLYQLLLRNTNESRELKKRIRKRRSPKRQKQKKKNLRGRMQQLRALRNRNRKYV